MDQRAYPGTTLETSGYMYDPLKADNIFGQPPGFNMPAAGMQPEPAMMFGTGHAIPEADTAHHDKPDLLTGSSNRPAPPTQSDADRHENAQNQWTMLGLFGAVLAAALYNFSV